MGIETKEIFDRYFETMSKDKVKKIRSQIDRQEVYEYEIKLGKSIFDMNGDELFDMVMTFGNNRERTPNTFVLSYATYTQIISMYRAVWNYYIDTVKPIRNPWNDKSMKGIEAEKRISKFKKAVSIDDILKTIKGLTKKPPEDIKYIECMVLLLYNGVPTSMDIVRLSESDINYRTKEITFSGGTVKLSDKCFELLQDVHNMISDSKKYIYVSYQGSYVTFKILKGKANIFQDKPIEMVSRIISKKIDTWLRSECGLDVGCRSIYLLGFYDYMVSQIGKEETDKIVCSYRDVKTTDQLIRYARGWGINYGNNITSFRRSLRQFAL